MSWKSLAFGFLCLIVIVRELRRLFRDGNTLDFVLATVYAVPFTIVFDCIVLPWLCWFVVCLFRKIGGWF